MTTPFAQLDAIARQESRTIAGLMSGTSADAIDVAIVRFTGDRPTIELLHAHEHPHDPETRRQVLRIGELHVREIAELHVRIAERFAEACRAAADAAGIPIESIDLVGSHGQTVYHHSGQPGALRCTLQLGDGDVVAVRTGRYVISDFRARDIAAGGEGAPLSPIADAFLFAPRPGEPIRRRAILNLGGIANLTILDPDPARTFGFDTGPANGPLDRLARRLTGGALSHDQDGQIAREGRVDERLLAWLVEDTPFLARKPPKSTGFEMFGEAFIDRAVEAHGGVDADLMATLTEFSARTVAQGLREHATVDPPIEELVAAGGGVRNPALMERIARLVEPVVLRRSDELGVPSDAREAMAFAVLADLTLRGVPAWLPPVTGASAPKLLGKVSFP